MKNENENLIKKLDAYDKSLGPIYRGAIRVINDTSNPDRISQSANSIREITNILFRGEKSVERKDASNRSKETLSKNIQKRIDPIGNTPVIYNAFSKFNSEIHSYFHKVSHHGPTNLNEYFGKLDQYEVKLMEFLADLAPEMDIIEKLVLVRNPSKHHIDILKNIKSSA